MKTLTVSYIQEHANHMELDEPVLVTQNGKPRFVIEDAMDYQYQQQIISLLRLINLSEKSCSSESLISMNDAFDFEI